MQPNISEVFQWADPEVTIVPMVSTIPVVPKLAMGPMIPMDPTSPGRLWLHADRLRLRCSPVSATVEGQIIARLGSNLQRHYA